MACAEEVNVLKGEIGPLAGDYGATMPKNRSVSTRAIPPPAGTDGHQKRVGNLILLSLPRREFTLLFSSLELVRLKLHQVMHETGEVIRSAYFNLILRARVHLFSPLLLNLALLWSGTCVHPPRQK
jgi:hypothetical protein